MGLQVKKSWLLLLAASIILSLAIPLALGGLDQFRLLQRLSWTVVFCLTLLALISWGFNALRTRFLLASLGRKISFWEAAVTTISAEFAGVTTPGAVGMPATYTFLFHNLGVNVGEAMGLVAIIIVTDVVYFGTIMTVVSLLEVFAGASPHNTLKLVGLIMLAVVGGGLVLGALILNYRRVCLFIGRHMGKVSWLALRRYRLARGTVQFIRALRSLRKMSWLQLTCLYLITLGFWMPRYLGQVVVIYLLGQSVPLAYLLLVQGVLNLGGQVFLMPGGGGAVEAGYVALMSPYLAREPLAFTLLVWRTYNFYWFLIVGGPIFLYKTGKEAQILLSRKK